MDLLTSIAIGILFGIGVFQLLRRNLLRSSIGLILVGNAVNLFLLSTGAYDGLAAAYSTAGEQRADALPQALVLTAIVIGMGALAFVLALIIVIANRYHTADMDEVNNLKH